MAEAALRCWARAAQGDATGAGAEERDGVDDWPPPAFPPSPAPDAVDADNADNADDLSGCCPCASVRQEALARAVRQAESYRVRALSLRAAEAAVAAATRACEELEAGASGAPGDAAHTDLLRAARCLLPALRRHRACLPSRPAPSPAAAAPLPRCVAAVERAAAWLRCLCPEPSLAAAALTAADALAAELAIRALRTYDAGPEAPHALDALLTSAALWRVTEAHTADLSDRVHARLLRAVAACEGLQGAVALCAALPASYARLGAGPALSLAARDGQAWLSWLAARKATLAAESGGSGGESMCELAGMGRGEAQPLLHLMPPSTAGVITNAAEAMRGALAAAAGAVAASLALLQRLSAAALGLASPSLPALPARSAVVACTVRLQASTAVLMAMWRAKGDVRGQEAQAGAPALLQLVSALAVSLAWAGVSGVAGSEGERIGDDTLASVLAPFNGNSHSVSGSGSGSSGGNLDAAVEEALLTAWGTALARCTHVPFVSARASDAAAAGVPASVRRLLQTSAALPALLLREGTARDLLAACDVRTGSDGAEGAEPVILAEAGLASLVRAFVTARCAAGSGGGGEVAAQRAARTSLAALMATATQLTVNSAAALADRGVLPLAGADESPAVARDAAQHAIGHLHSLADRVRAVLPHKVGGPGAVEGLTPPSCAEADEEAAATATAAPAPPPAQAAAAAAGEDTAARAAERASDALAAMPGAAPTSDAQAATTAAPTATVLATPAAVTGDSAASAGTSRAPTAPASAGVKRPRDLDSESCAGTATDATDTADDADRTDDESVVSARDAGAGAAAEPVSAPRKRRRRGGRGRRASVARQPGGSEALLAAPHGPPDSRPAARPWGPREAAAGPAAVPAAVPPGAARAEGRRRLRAERPWQEKLSPSRGSDHPHVAPWQPGGRSDRPPPPREEARHSAPAARIALQVAMWGRWHECGADALLWAGADRTFQALCVHSSRCAAR